MNVLHIAYGHIKNDIRIVQKECVSLANNGYKVYYTTYDRESDKSVTPENVEYIPLKAINKTLLVNYFINKDLLKAYCSVIETVQPQIVHIHEYGISFLVRYIKKHYKGIKVIYDAHEDNAGTDYERDVKKYGILMAKILVILRSYKERQACRYADYVITATPHIKELLEKYNHFTEVIHNYPLLHDWQENDQKFFNLRNGVCYVGGLTEERGITTIVSISDRIDEKVYLAGPIDEKYLKRLKESNSDSYNKKWYYLGVLQKDEVLDVYFNKSVGLCLFKKAVNHYQALPNKIFEYMEAGIPVVVSDFPIWRDIVDTSKCGFCVDEEDPNEISSKINYLLSHKEEAAQMGINGRKVVYEKYNWQIEEKKLIEIYKSLIS
jgi:glycosyltransferase involved in cell wall biosynthesis